MISLSSVRKEEKPAKIERDRLSQTGSLRKETMSALGEEVPTGDLLAATETKAEAGARDPQRSLHIVPDHLTATEEPVNGNAGAYAAKTERAEKLFTVEARWRWVEEDRQVTDGKK